MHKYHHLAHKLIIRFFIIMEFREYEFFGIFSLQFKLNYKESNHLLVENNEEIDVKYLY